MNLYASQTYASWDLLENSNQDNIVLNGFSLQNEFITTSFFWENNLIDSTSFDYPKSNWRWLLWYYLRWKNLNLRIKIKWDSVEDFQTRLDNFRKIFFQEEINLDVRVNWIIRRIKVNWKSAPKNLEHYNITFLNIEVSLEVLEPFFYELSNQSNSFLNKTETFDEYIINKWSAVSDLRIFIMELSESWI